MARRSFYGPDASSNFHALRPREGQAAAVLVAFDLLELDGRDIRPEPLGRRRARLQRLLGRARGKAARAIAEGIQLSDSSVGKLN